jgi:hypothetical protein
MSTPRKSILGASGLAHRTGNVQPEDTTQRPVGSKPKKAAASAAQPSGAPEEKQPPNGPLGEGVKTPEVVPDNAPPPPPPPPATDPVPEEERVTKSAGRGKTIYFHPHDEERIDDLSTAVKRWNRSRKTTAGEDYVRGAIGGSLFARVGILLANQLKDEDPERFYELTRRIANEDLENL